GDDELSTRSAALSYYFVLAVFPLFLFLVSLVGIFAGQHSQLRDTIISGLGKMAPGSASQLVQSVINETFKSSGGLKLLAGIFGALWAASSGMGAVIVSLNVIYRVRESRPWWKQRLTAVGLTAALAGLIIVAITIVLYGGKIGDAVGAHIGLSLAFQIAWKIIQWPLSVAAMFLSFSILYYFGPNVEHRNWYWVTPGAAIGVALWLAASIGFRIYLHFFNSYSATYGSLGAAIILLLWLYITGFTILMGGEVNALIEDTDKKNASFEKKKRAIQDRLPKGERVA
ncbi:MAG: YihY/virulence factor BrkB family protein, partial [Acidobacteriota bacterium]|nr:YihY/virulence factor BrkB family protein [Acidobacteriota bacterium]